MILGGADDQDCGDEAEDDRKPLDRHSNGNERFTNVSPHPTGTMLWS